MTWLNSLLCLVFGHKTRHVRDLLIGGELVECELCQVKLCVHHGRQQVILYDSDVEEAEEQIRKLMRHVNEM